MFINKIIWLLVIFPLYAQTAGADQGGVKTEPFVFAQDDPFISAPLKKYLGQSVNEQKTDTQVALKPSPVAPAKSAGQVLEDREKYWRSRGRNDLADAVLRLGGAVSQGNAATVVQTRALPEKAENLASQPGEVVKANGTPHQVQAVVPAEKPVQADVLVVKPEKVDAAKPVQDVIPAVKAESAVLAKSESVAAPVAKPQLTEVPAAMPVQAAVPAKPVQAAVPATKPVQDAIPVVKPESVAAPVVKPQLTEVPPEKPVQAAVPAQPVQELIPVVKPEQAVVPAALPVETVAVKSAPSIIQSPKAQADERARYWATRGRGDLSALNQIKQSDSTKASEIPAQRVVEPVVPMVTRAALDPALRGVLPVPEDSEGNGKQPSAQVLDESAQYWEARGRSDLSERLRQSTEPKLLSRGAVSDGGRPQSSKKMQYNQDTEKSALENLLLKNPGSPKARLDLAQIYQGAGEYARARALIDSVLAGGPDLPEALYASAQLYAEQHLWRETLYALDKISPVSRRDDMAKLQKTAWAHVQLDRAEALVRQGNNRDAELLIREVAAELAVNHNQTPAAEPPALWNAKKQTGK